MSTVYLTVTILSNLRSMFKTTTGATQESSQNTKFETFEQNTRTSSSGWQLFGNIGGFNLLLNNNNNLSSGRLDSNIAALINALIGMNLTERYYLREGNFIKSTKFGRTKTENLNE